MEYFKISLNESNILKQSNNINIEMKKDDKIKKSFFN